MELSAQEKGQVDHTSPAHPWPNRLGTLRNPICSIQLAGNTAPRLFPVWVACGQPTLLGTGVKLYCWVGKERPSQLS